MNRAFTFFVALVLVGCWLAVTTCDARISHKAKVLTSKASTTVNLGDFVPDWNTYETTYRTDFYVMNAGHRRVVRRSSQLTVALTNMGTVAPTFTLVSYAVNFAHVINLAIVTTLDGSNHVTRAVITFPADAPIGRYSFQAHHSGADFILGTAYVIFNPTAGSTDAEVETQLVPQALDSYVFSDVSAYYSGSNVGDEAVVSVRFDEILPDLMYMLETHQMNQAGRQSAYDIASFFADHVQDKWWTRVGVDEYAQITAATRANYLLMGLWDRDLQGDARFAARRATSALTYETAAGHHEPWNWADVNTIFTAFRNNGYRAAKYGQCFTFGRLTTGIMRALGIPSRIASSIDCCEHKPHWIIPYNEANWNFHVWSEIFITIPGLNPRAWSVIDATYGYIPTPVPFVRDSGNHWADHNVALVAAEVKSPKFLVNMVYPGHADATYGFALAANLVHFNRRYCTSAVWVKRFNGVRTDLVATYKEHMYDDPWNFHSAIPGFLEMDATTQTLAPNANSFLALNFEVTATDTALPAFTLKVKKATGYEPFTTGQYKVVFALKLSDYTGKLLKPENGEEIVIKTSTVEVTGANIETAQLEVVKGDYLESLKRSNFAVASVTVAHASRNDGKFNFITQKAVKLTSLSFTFTLGGQAPYQPGADVTITAKFTNPLESQLTGIAVASTVVATQQVPATLNAGAELSLSFTYKAPKLASGAFQVVLNCGQLPPILGGISIPTVAYQQQTQDEFAQPRALVQVVAKDKIDATDVPVKYFADPQTTQEQLAMLLISYLVEEFTRLPEKQQIELVTQMKNAKVKKSNLVSPFKDAMDTDEGNAYDLAIGLGKRKRNDFEIPVIKV